MYGRRRQAGAPARRRCFERAQQRCHGRHGNEGCSPQSATPQPAPQECRVGRAETKRSPSAAREAASPGTSAHLQRVLGGGQESGAGRGAAQSFQQVIVGEQPGALRGPMGRIGQQTASTKQERPALLLCDHARSPRPPLRRRPSGSNAGGGVAFLSSESSSFEVMSKV